MPRSCLLLSVRFHEGRYHGVPDWPPSPARLFQALVAGAARGAILSSDAMAALQWMEALDAPAIAIPKARRARGYTNYVPNNDLDAVGGDIHRIGEIRAGKNIRPQIFDPATPLLYFWNFKEGDDAKTHAEQICTLALDLYQFGRGVDMAWAFGEVLQEEAIADRLSGYPGVIHRPSEYGETGGKPLACPAPGSLSSLIDRHKAAARRFTIETTSAPNKKRKVVGQLFSQAPKPRFRPIVYDCPTALLLFDLVASSGRPASWSFTEPVALVERLRDNACARLSQALPDRKPQIERVFVGRDATDKDKASRIRIVPLPSIGHAHADRAIRRVLLEIPPNCPLEAADIEWSFSSLIDPETGEFLNDGPVLVRAPVESMLVHYGIKPRERFHVWRTVTPAALSAARRRIHPMRKHEEAKGGKERASEEASAAAAVVHALRHTGVEARVESIRVQREPFEARGARAEVFSLKPRFTKERLWHAEITFSNAIDGPLVIGDGRYLGLGLMAPKQTTDQNFLIFNISAANRPPVGNEAPFLRAVRRALMALDRDHGDGEISQLFSGHEADGRPDCATGNHRHVFLAATGDGTKLSTLYIFAPQCADRRTKLKDQTALMRRFYSVGSRLSMVRAGSLGLISLERADLNMKDDRVIATALKWVSETPYFSTRNSKKLDQLETIIVRDIYEECNRRGLPKPDIDVRTTTVGPRSGISARVGLAFQTPVTGPIILGRNSHFGLGLFTAEEG